jgi:hypothetical protein
MGPNRGSDRKMDTITKLGASLFAFVTQYYYPGDQNTEYKMGGFCSTHE